MSNLNNTNDDSRESTMDVDSSGGGTKGKIGFSIKKGASQPAKRKEPSTDEKRDYVYNVFAGSLQSVNPAVSQGPLVIPRMENTWKPLKRTRGDADRKGEATETTKADTSPDAAQPTATAAEATVPPAPGPPAEATPQSLEERFAFLAEATLTQEELERQKVREDLQHCAPDTDGGGSIPVEEFGTALLRGMGWEEGKPIGRNPSKGLVAPIEFVPRPKNLGLGATPKLPEKPDKTSKSGKSREQRPDLVVKPDADGRQRHYRTLDEKLVPRKMNVLDVGALVSILYGPHEGLSGKVSKVEKKGDRKQFHVRLSISGEVVKVEESDLSLMDPTKMSAEHPALQETGSSGEEEENEQEAMRKTIDRRDDKKYRDDRDTSSSRKAGAKADGREKPDPIKWVRPNIRVRVIDKHLKRGEYYNKKAVVVDVVNKYECNIQLESGKIVEGVLEKALETVVPRNKGDRVMCLTGQFKGHTGRLLERDSLKERCVVQLDEDMKVTTVHFDDIAEYVSPIC